MDREEQERLLREVEETEIKGGFADVTFVAGMLGGKMKELVLALREGRDCLHASQTRYVGCGGMAYWICDECERAVGKKHRYIDGQESEWP